MKNYLVCLFDVDGFTPTSAVWSQGKFVYSDLKIALKEAKNFRSETLLAVTLVNIDDQVLLWYAGLTLCQAKKYGSGNVNRINQVKLLN